MTAFLTGFPGFLGVELVSRLLSRGESVVALVQSQYREKAQEQAATLRKTVGGDGDTLTLVTGDITAVDLALEDPAAVRERIDDVYHLAAVYDLAVDPEPARVVNVRGTEHVLDFAERAAVDRFQYVSTCYVSGRYEGVFGPGDLDVGQSFNNHYEATKFEAERRVQERMGRDLTVTIYRPAIVVGDSDTGETEKYDGLYYLLGLVERQPGVAVVPVQPPAEKFEFNVVPRDYVVDAIAHLSNRQDTADEVYQLCDPNPPTVRQLVDLCGDALDRRVVQFPIHARASRRLIESVPGLEGLLGVEPASIDYLSYPTTYVSPNARRALSGSGISPPPLRGYIDRLASYMREHPDRERTAMT